MKLTLQVWRQETTDSTGRWEFHELDGLEPSMSVLEVLDQLNLQLVAEGKPGIVFDSDCREGVCGACGIMIDGQAQGPARNTPTCHQRLWSFHSGQTVRLEPLRAGAFPVLSDLAVDRSALDALIAIGGHVDIDAGTAPPANTLPVGHKQAAEALDFAACLSCGACVAACPNGSANLFLGAKLRHLSLLPLAELERAKRARSMVALADEFFGPCSNYGECAIACPASIPLAAVSVVDKERMRAGWKRYAEVE